MSLRPYIPDEIVVVKGLGGMLAGLVAVIPQKAELKKRIAKIAVQGSTEIILQNKPQKGFILSTVCYYYESPRAKIYHPLGFEFTISYQNMDEIIRTVVIDKGAINAEMMFVMHNNELVLALTDSDLVKNASSYEDAFKTKKSSTMVPGSIVLTDDNMVLEYIGTKHVIKTQGISWRKTQFNKKDVLNSITQRNSQKTYFFHVIEVLKLNYVVEVNDRFVQYCKDKAFKCEVNEVQLGIERQVHFSGTPKIKNVLYEPTEPKDTTEMLKIVTNKLLTNDSPFTKDDIDIKCITLTKANLPTSEYTISDIMYAYGSSFGFRFDLDIRRRSQQVQFKLPSPAVVKKIKDTFGYVNLLVIAEDPLAGSNGQHDKFMVSYYHDSSSRATPTIDGYLVDKFVPPTEKSDDFEVKLKMSSSRYGYSSQVDYKQYQHALAAYDDTSITFMMGYVKKQNKKTGK